MFEIFKDVRRTNEQAGIDGIVMLQLFSNRNDAVPLCLNFGRVIWIENRVELPVNCEVELIGNGVADEQIQHRFVKEVIAHRQKEGAIDLVGRNQN